MLHSMTGFARESAETALGTLTWEIRAVNHRYLDVQFKLPEDLRPKEQAFRQQASTILGRGKVECGLYFRRAVDQQTEMQIDTDLVELLGTRISELSGKLPATAAINPIEILRWPGVMRQPEVDVEPLFGEASTLLNIALNSIDDMRLSEGRRIAEEARDRIMEVAGVTPEATPAFTKPETAKDGGETSSLPPSIAPEEEPGSGSGDDAPEPVYERVRTSLS